MKKRNGHSKTAVPDALEGAGVGDAEAGFATTGNVAREPLADVSGESSDTLTLYLRDGRRP